MLVAGQLPQVPQGSHRWLLPQHLRRHPPDVTGAHSVCAGGKERQPASVCAAPTQGCCSTTTWATAPPGPRSLRIRRERAQRPKRSRGRECPRGRPPAREGSKMPQGPSGCRAREGLASPTDSEIKDPSQNLLPKWGGSVELQLRKLSLSLTDQDTELLRQLPPTRGQDLPPDILENDRPRLQVHHQHGAQLGLGPLQFHLEGGEATEPLQPLKEGSALSPKPQRKPPSPTSYLAQHSSH